MANEFTILTGTANSRLAENVAREVGVRLGARAVERFPEGEISVRLEEPARGREVFIIQPTSPPVDVHLVELLAFADACRRASAANVTAVIPYFGYARSDKRHGRREPIMASMVGGRRARPRLPDRGRHDLDRRHGGQEHRGAAQGGREE